MAVVLPPGEVANGHERSLASERGDQREQRLFTLRPDDEVDDAGREHGVGMLRRKVAAPYDLQVWPRSANRLAHWHGLNKLRAWHDGDRQQVRLRAARGRKSVKDCPSRMCFDVAVHKTPRLLAFEDGSEGHDRQRKRLLARRG